MQQQWPPGAGRSGRSDASLPDGTAVTDRALGRAIVMLGSGLSADRALVAAAGQKGQEPDWRTMKVVGDLPPRFRRSYDVCFVERLARAGSALVHDWERGTAAPDCPAQFLLARWLLDRAVKIADLTGEYTPESERRWACELGLSRGTVTDSGGEAWLTSWSLDSIRIDPATWFAAAVFGVPGSSAPTPPPDA